MNPPVSSREQRKAAQLAAILEREENRRIRDHAAAIARKGHDLRTPQDSIFIQQNRRLVEKAERKAQEAVLEEQRKKELFDNDADLAEKSRILTDALKSAKHVIVYTGAGISTAADIPDYRGPNGLWTRTEKGESCVDPLKPLDLTKAQPTYTHMALVKLHEAGIVKYLVSQNCDGLHVRSGFPRTSLSEVHGNMYLEVCGECDLGGPPGDGHLGGHYFRSFDVTSKTRWRRHRTGRQCHGCGGELEDTIVLFGEKSRTDVPMNWDAATSHSNSADVVLCLGTSLKVLKDYRTLWHRHHKLFIVNLQWTPKDEGCHLKIHGRCDDVMRNVMRRLSLTPDTFSQQKDLLHSLVVPLRRKEEKEREEMECLNGGVGGVGGRAGWLGQGVKGLLKRTQSQMGARKKKQHTNNT